MIDGTRLPLAFHEIYNDNSTPSEQYYRMFYAHAGLWAVISDTTRLTFEHREALHDLTREALINISKAIWSGDPQQYLDLKYPTGEDKVLQKIVDSVLDLYRHHIQEIANGAA
jgi:hypothetical protein